MILRLIHYSAKTF